METISYRAKVTMFDSGATVVEPYRETGSPRYEHLLQTEYTQLRRTKKHYIVVFRFPLVGGIIAATRQLICECSRIAVLMMNEYFNHNEL